MRSKRFRQSAKTPSDSPRARASRSTSKMRADSTTATAAGSRAKTAFHPALLRGDDGGVDDGVQVIQPAFAESKLGEAGAVKMAIGKDDSGTEGADDVVVNLVPRLHEGAAQLVSFDHLGAEGAKLRRDGGFAAAETAGKAYAEHGRMTICMNEVCTTGVE